MRHVCKICRCTVLWCRSNLDHGALVVLWLGTGRTRVSSHNCKKQMPHHFTLAPLGRHSAVVNFWSLAMGMECWDAPTVCWDAPTVCTLLEA
jgi:hypothetical protein